MSDTVALFGQPFRIFIFFPPEGRFADLMQAQALSLTETPIFEAKNNASCQYFLRNSQFFLDDIVINWYKESE